MTIIGLFGPPASGKSTIMRAFIDVHLTDHTEGRTELDNEYFKWKLCVGHIYHGKKVIVLGRYKKGEKFQGTDRMSMIAQKDVQAWLSSVMTEQKYHDYTVFFEGDRLATPSFLRFLGELEVKRQFFMVTVTPEVREQRRAERVQNPTWVKGRESKCRNLLEAFKPLFKILPNNTQEDRDFAVRTMHNAMRVLNN